jgi:hypothetical protein
MADYRVIAPYVTLKVKDPTGGAVMLGFYQGAVVSDVDEESLKHHLDGGFIEKVTSDKQLYESTGDPAGASAPTLDADPANDDVPKRSAAKKS